MLERVVPDDMTLFNDLADNGGKSLGLLADQEEGCRNAQFRQEVQQPRGVFRGVDRRRRSDKQHHSRPVHGVMNSRRGECRPHTFSDDSSQERRTSRSSDREKKQPFTNGEDLGSRTPQPGKLRCEFSEFGATIPQIPTRSRTEARFPVGRANPSDRAPVRLPGRGLQDPRGNEDAARFISELADAPDIAGHERSTAGQRLAQDVRQSFGSAWKHGQIGGAVPIGQFIMEFGAHERDVLEESASFRLGC